MRANLSRFVAVLLLSLCTVAIAAESPVVMLQQTSDKMITALKKNQATIKNNPKLVFSLVRSILLPKVDIVMMSRSVLGRDAWQSASRAQRSEFIRAFTDTLIRTYATAFASYTNETVKFLPVRGGDGNRMEVRSIIVRTSGPNIPVSYRVILRGSRWKVYDFSVEGVSLVQSFRSQFAGEISRGGIAGLLAKMSSHNRGRQ